MLQRTLALLAGLLLVTLATAQEPEPTLTLALGQNVPLELVLVKKGTFQQGSPVTEQDRNDDEKQRAVTISQDFYIGKYPVTRGQFGRFVQETGYRTEAEKGTSGGYGWDGTKLVQRREFTWRNPGFAQTDDHPVTIVTYEDAQAFATWLGKKTGRRVSLPTEAQWEYACRARTTTRFYNGDRQEDAGDIAWFKANAGNGTRPVGQKKANAWGLHDMAGNVYEWCRDWYGPYEPGPVVDPEEKRSNLSTPARRVLRGGSWLKDARHCRSAARYRNEPRSRNADNGFRVVVATAHVPIESPPEQPPATGKAKVVPAFPEPEDVDISKPVPATPGAAFFPGAPCCIGSVVLVALVVMAVLLSRSWVRSAEPERLPPEVAERPGDPGRIRPPPLPRDLQIHIVEDGFWVQAPGLPHQSVIRWRCLVGMNPQSGSFAYEPGPQGQFVYTGSTPRDVTIIEILPPESSESYLGEYESGIGPTFMTPTRRSSFSSPSQPPTRRHPPAY